MSFESLLYDQGQAPDIVDEINAPGTTYLGWAQAGTVATAEPKFKIKRISVNGGITVTEWANGNREFNNIWDNRGALIYSFLK